jgi:outer membrane protein TolC
MKIDIFKYLHIKKLCYVFLFLPILTVSAQENLQKHLETAATNNTALKADFNEYLAALEKIPQVGALPDPKLSFEYFTQAVETRLGAQQAKFSAVQNFPWFGTLEAKEAVAAEFAKGKLELFEQSKSKLFYAVKATYFKIYFANKAIEITKENISILKTLQELAIVKLETGLASAVDEIRVELEINKLENQLAEFQSQKTALEIQFQNLLSVDTVLNLEFPDTLWAAELPIQKEVLLDSIKEQNHLLKELTYKAEAWQKQTLVAKKQGMPQFSLGTTYILTGKRTGFSDSQNGKDAFIFPKVGISLPIYRKKYKAMVKEAELKKEAINFRKEDKEKQLASSLEVVFKDFEDAKLEVVLYEKQTNLTQKALNILLEAYSTDGKDFEEILRLERKLLKYSLELSKSRSQRNTAVAFIDYLLGN